MSETSFLARVMELNKQVAGLTRENESLGVNLAAAEDAAVAMERDRDEQLEIVNRHGVTPAGELEFEIRMLKQRIVAKDDDFEYLNVLADGYKAQRDAARKELLGEEVDTEILDLTLEEVKAVATGEDIVPFHKTESGKLVADKPNAGGGLIADHRRVTEELGEAREDVVTYMVRVTALEEALKRAEIRNDDLERGIVVVDATLKRTKKELERTYGELESARESAPEQVMTLRQEVRDLVDAEQDITNQVNDLLHVVADNTEKLNNGAEVILNLRGQVATLTIRTDELTFERDRANEEFALASTQMDSYSRDLIAREKERDDALRDLAEARKTGRADYDRMKADRNIFRDRLNRMNEVNGPSATLEELTDMQLKLDEARRERDTLRDKAEAEVAQLHEELTRKIRELGESRSEVEQLDEELTAVRNQRDEKDTIIEAMTANAATLDEAFAEAEKYIDATPESAALIVAYREKVAEAEAMIEMLSVDLDTATEEQEQHGLARALREAEEVAVGYLEERDEFEHGQIAASELAAGYLEERDTARQQIEGISEIIHALQEDADGAFAALEISEEKLVGTERVLELALHKIMALETPDPDNPPTPYKPEPGDDPDDDPEDDPTAPTGGDGGLRQAIAERTEALTKMRAEDASSELKTATVAGPGPRIMSDDPAPEAPEKPTTPSATPSDKFPSGIGDCQLSRLGYDGDDGVFFDRSRPMEVDGETRYAECDPEEIVVELEAEVREMDLNLVTAKGLITDLDSERIRLTDQLHRAADIEHEGRVKLDKQKALTADRLSEQRLLQRELREETEKNAALRKNLKQAIGHIDAMTVAVMDQTPQPPPLECMHDDDDVCECEETDADVRKMLAVYRTKFVQLAETKFELEKQVRDLQAKLDPASLHGGYTETPARGDFSGVSMAEVAEHGLSTIAPGGDECEHYCKGIGCGECMPSMDNDAIAGHECRDGCRICKWFDASDGSGRCNCGANDEEPHEPREPFDCVRWLGTRPGEGMCQCGAGGKLHVPTAHPDCAQLNVAPCAAEEPAGPTGLLDRHKVVATGMGILKAAKSREPDVTVEDSATAIGAKIVNGPESPADDSEAWIQSDVIEGRLPSASACTRVWLAPAKRCTSDGGLHGFSNPTARHGHADLPPYCPQCHESFTLGPRPMDPNVEYVVPKEARRMTGS